MRIGGQRARDKEPQRILVLGAGFAGLWSAIGAARALDERGIGADEIEITVLDRNPYHSIRVRNYEADLAPTIVPLAEVLDPIGVRHVAGEAAEIDPSRRTVLCADARAFTYDRLVFALGSRLAWPPIPGLREHAADVDTYEAARRLGTHLATLASRPDGAGRDTVLVIGAGLTGIETAAEMPDRLRAAGVAKPRVILADRQAWIGSDMGEPARGVIAEALGSLGVEMRPGLSLAAVDAGGARFADGERIDAATIVWCAGLQAHPLAARLATDRDRLGRVRVDEFLRISGCEAEFAAGDACWLPIDGVHPSVMSCQHGRPMGRFAGHNAVAHLLGEPMLPLSIAWYVTVLDLGPWGAVYTEGWDRQVAATGAAAKRTKQTINRERIYPPRNGDRRAILAAAAPAIQTPPPRRAQS